MRTILKALFHSAILIWFILHLTCPQITHTYIGTVCGETVVAEKQLMKNSGSHVKYIFKYKDKEGNIRDSESIQGHSNSNGFVTDSGTWVEKQLVKNGKVYIPGWHPGMVFEFVCLCAALAFFFFAFLFSVICFVTDDRTCRCCDCPVCVFEKETLEEDKPFFDAISKHVKSFLNL